MRIPNEEIRQEFARTIWEGKRSDMIRWIRESDQLILDTINGNLGIKNTCNLWKSVL